MEVTGELPAPTTLPLGKEPPITYWIGGRVGLRVSLDAMAKKQKITSPLPEIEP